jgi:sec-independent protein translocase protein TatA
VHFDNPVNLLVLGIIALLVLGPKRLPEFGRSLGHGIREFKDSISGEGKSDELEARQDSETPSKDSETPSSS